MSLKPFQSSQLKTLRAFAPRQEGAAPCYSCPEAAERLGVSEGAARHRLMRYARKGWLTRLRGLSGWTYQITPRGLARLEWLQTQADSGSFLKTLLD